MSNPRLMAEDVASHYMVKIDSRFPHSKNIRRHLRLPLLATTRRILLPRIDYAELRAEVGTFGGVNHIDPTSAKSKDGLDWRDYVSSKSLLKELHHNHKSETEVSDLSEDNQTLHQYYLKRQPHGEMKLTRRSLARMEAFLATCALALPDEYILPSRMNKSKSNKHSNADTDINTASNKATGLMSGLQSFTTSFTGNQKQKKTIVSSTGTRARTHTNTGNYRYPQIHINDLTLRLELYIRNLRRIFALREQQLQQNKVPSYGRSDKEQVECVLKFDPPRVIHKRTQIIIRSLIATTNSVGSMRPILTKLLTYVTRELLAVEHLSEELDGYIRKIILEYEHLTSFASLAFLSSPGDSAETHLSPLLFNYFEYLNTECDMCIEKCKLESMLARAIHPGMRSVFKNAEFLSIGHLLEVCEEYRGQLENIVFSPKESDCFGIGFTMGVGDSSSETPMSLSSDIIASVVSGDVSEVKKCNTSITRTIKQALKDLRREIITVNGHMLPPAQSLTELVQLLRERLHSRTVKLKDRKVAYTKKNSNFQKNCNTEDSSLKDQIESDSGTSYSGDNDIISSGNEGDTDGSSSLSSKKRGKTDHENSICAHGKKHLPIPNGANKAKRRQFNVNATDIMIRRLLIAASRTGSGGDAFFVVRDLFGGEGAEIFPSIVSPMGPYIHGKVSPTIELNVRLTCIIIRCHSTFNVYPKPYTGECEALIQLHTTTTETIELQEVRVDDRGNEILSIDNASQQENETRKPTKLMLKEKKTGSSGRRILSIKPARYERVENWHTPS